MVITSTDGSTPPERRIGFAVACWTLRIAATIQLILLGSQPIIIGQYLDGRYAMIGVHADVGTALTLLGFLFIGLTSWYALAGGRWWVMPFGLIFVFAIEIQLGMGYAGQLGIHVPLGVAVIALGVAFGAWVWTPAARRARPRRRDRRIARDAARLADVAEHLQAGSPAQPSGGSR
jgi:hypothetical protein